MRQFEKSYRARERDDVLSKLNSISQSLDLRLDAVEQVKAAFESGNRLDVDALLASINGDYASKSAAIARLLGEVAQGFTPNRIATTPAARFTSDAEIGALHDADAELSGRLDRKANATSLGTHTGDTSNPHQVTAGQVGAYTHEQVDDLLAMRAPADATSQALAVRLTRDEADARYPRLDGTNAGQIGGLRNPLINAEMRIWNRGGVITVPAKAVRYTADRWRIASDNNADLTVSPSTMIVDGRVENCLQITAKSQPSGGKVYFSQMIEDVTTFQARRSCSSIVISGPLGPISAYCNQNFRDADNHVQYSVSPVVPVPAGINRISLVQDIPGAGGLTPGATGYLEWGIILDIQSTDPVKIALPQFEAGGAPTPFERRPEALDRMLCARFYRYIPYAIATPVAPSDPSTRRLEILFSPDMRRAPDYTYARTEMATDIFLDTQKWHFRMDGRVADNGNWGVVNEIRLDAEIY